VGQIEAAAEAARIAQAVLDDGASAKEATEKIDEIENQGDDARGKLAEELTRALGTPIDHEDMFRVSRSVDDVLDNLRDFVFEVDLFGAEDVSILRPPLEPIARSLDELKTAIEKLDGDAESVTSLGLRAQKTASLVRRRYQECLGDLFGRDEVSVEMLRQRELLRRLDVIGLRLQEATAALSDGLMKRGLT
jgi:uncharacterized protein Yka (UPF0111/DUF47 family)